MIRINKEWRAKQLSQSLINNRIVNKATALSLSIVALGLMGVSKVNASDVPLPIKRIGLNNDNQIVVYFGKREGEFPTPPHLLDTPGPNHRIVIEFADAIVDKVNMPDAADLSTKLHKQLFGIKSIRYVTVAGGETSRARVVIEVAEQLKVRPRVVKLEEDSVTINLGDDIVEQSAVLEGPVKGRTRSRAVSTNSQSQVAEAGAPTMIAQNDSKPEIPIPSNSDADPDVTVTSGRSATKVTEVASAAPSMVQSIAPVASSVADAAVGTASTTTVASTSNSTSDADGMPALRTAPLAITADPKPTASSETAAARSKSVDDDMSSQVADSMPSSPKTKAATSATSPIKMPETLTNAGANLKKFMHWPHKDDATASASTKDSSKDTSTSSSSSSKKVVADAKTSSTKQTTSQTTTVASDATGLKTAARDAKEVKKEVAGAANASTNSDATKDSSPSKLSKLNLFAKLPRPAFAKPKSPDVVAAAHVNTSKPTKNTVVDADAESSDATIVAAKSGSASSTNNPSPAPTQMPVADAASSEAAPEGAEFNAAFANQASSTTAKSTNLLASASAPTPSAAATSAPTPASDNAPPAPGSWDWTATSASKPVKQTAVSTASALTAASTGDAVVSKATNAATDVVQSSSTRPVQIAQDMPADDRPKISTPIETTETQTFSQPAQMLTPGSSTSVTEGAQEVMKVKAKEQEVKPETVAETEKSDFAAAMKSTPTKKQKVEETASNESALIRDTEMTDPAVEKTATKMPVETETPAGEMPAQVAPETNTAAAAASEIEPTAVDKTKLATARYNDAVKAHLSGKLPEAIASYKEALAANPELAEAHSNLGLIYNQQHKYEMAVSEFQKALAVNPKDAITYNGIGAALRAQKDLNGAIKNFQTAVSLDPKLATAHYNLGVAYELQRDYDRSLNSYEQAIKCDYRLGEAYYRMGMILEKRHRNDDARAKFKAALKASENADYSKDARERLASLESKPTR
jgi:Tfp pilus assembly protein PilF